MEMRRDVSGFMMRKDPQLAAWARELGDWPDRTVAEFARDRFEAHPERIQIVDEGREISCRELYEGACALAGYFDAIGLKAGEVISFQIPNWWEANVINLAAAMMGIVVNPIVPINREHEVSYMLDTSRTKVMFVPEVFRKFDYPAMMQRLRTELSHPPQIVVVRGERLGDHLRFEDILTTATRVSGPRDVDPDALKLLLYTSGTTGRPKGVLHTHNTVHADGMKMVPALGLDANDMTFSPSPITHVSGYLWVLNHPWLKDIPAVTVDVWNPERAFDLIERYRCAFMLGATPFLQDMLAIAKVRRSRLPFLRQYLCGGAAVPPALIYEAVHVFENCIAWRNFGASEAMTMTRGPRSRANIKHGAETDGELIHCKVKVLDLTTDKPVAPGEDGEILTWEPSMAAGYVRSEDNDAAYDPDGYFRMGDIGRLVDGDYVIVTGRKKDLIIRSGENISAKEIEDTLADHPMVAEIAVVSMPSKVTGEAICAFIVPKGGAQPAVSDLDRAVAAAGLARQKTPEHVVLVGELPRTASGKIRKDLLREQARTLAGAMPS